jgi:hypothetical protein
MVGVAPPDLELLRKQAADALAKKSEARKPSAASTAVTAAPPAKKARLDMKGTMVGVAPPGIAALRKDTGASANEKGTASPDPARPEAARPAASAHFKGTMVGLAPPAVEELRRQAEQIAQAKNQAPAAKSPPAHLKGTMIGVAPPNMQAELEKAKQAIVEQKAAKQAASSKPAIEPSRGPERPSKLKGTMIGVAPPEMQVELAQARKDFEAHRAEEAQSRAMAAASQKKDEPPSEPDPFKGTVVGTSPFATPPSVQGSKPAPSDFSEDTPAALSSQREAARLSSAGGPLSGFSAAAPGSSAVAPFSIEVEVGSTVDISTRSDTEEMPSSLDTAQMLARGELPPVAGRKPARAFAPEDEGEEKSTSLGKVVLIASLVIVGIAAIFFMTRGGSSKDTVEAPPVAAPPIDGAKADPAPAQ